MWQYAGEQQQQQQQGDLGNRQPVGDAWTVCRNGPSCLWLANQRCRFKHEASPASNVENYSNNNANTVAPTSSTSTSGNTLENCIKAVMDRLEQLERRMPPIINLAGFPPMEGGKKTQ